MQTNKCTGKQPEMVERKLSEVQGKKRKKTNERRVVLQRKEIQNDIKPEADARVGVRRDMRVRKDEEGINERKRTLQRR